MIGGEKFSVEAIAGRKPSPVTTGGLTESIVYVSSNPETGFMDGVGPQVRADVTGLRQKPTP